MAERGRKVQGMGPLEQEIVDALQAPVAGTAGDAAYKSGNPNWWSSLTRDQRDELLLFSLAGISDAFRRLARHVDEAEGAASSTGNN